MTIEKKSLNDWKALQQLIEQKGKVLTQDTIFHAQSATSKEQKESKNHAEQQDIAFYFSDEYQPLLKQNPISYARDEAAIHNLKKLKKGFYEPDLFLDLHGLTQKETKKELAALIQASLAERLVCACVMYGHGKNILKAQTPLWLAQHPKVNAFHEAPRHLGGNAALLILFDIEEMSPLF